MSDVWVRPAVPERVTITMPHELFAHLKAKDRILFDLGATYEVVLLHWPGGQVDLKLIDPEAPR